MMRPFLTTIYSPALLDLYDIENTVFVVIDVFRATSTIPAALYNGAKEVIPVAGAAECIRIGNETPNSITAGEREGRVIPGLQYGNSPLEYTKDLIQGKSLVLTTTNGTKLLHMAISKGASDIMTCSFLNLTATVQELKAQQKNVVLGCSAWKDVINIEDTMLAGAVAFLLSDTFQFSDDSTRMAMDMYLRHRNDVKSFVQTASHWERLSKYGLEKDLDYCLTIDAANIPVRFQSGKLLVCS